MKNSSKRVIEVKALARVEGEGALRVTLKDDEIVDLRFQIFEPPRFFEAFLQGRSYNEVPDITARICGICPVAYQMSSVHALEQAFGLKLGEDYAQLRRLLYCGEWIESHALHILMLHAPDFFGLSSVLELNQRFPQVVEQGLRLKKAGNALVTVVGGREVHPINVRVGGFYRAPERKELRELIPSLKEARNIAREVLDWVADFPFPELEIDYEFVSLKDPREYPMNRGRLVSNKGIDICADEFTTFFEERQVEHSNALHCLRRDTGGSYQVGPLARFNLCFEQLPASLQKIAAERGFTPPCNNPFKSIIARALETLYACQEALRIIESYQRPDRPYLEPDIKAGSGSWFTEAPRGILFHSYDVDENGLIKRAEIVPPTSQNQARMEDDLRRLIPTLLHLPIEEMRARCEQAIRNYDPCISCATHFLRLDIERL